MFRATRAWLPSLSGHCVNVFARSRVRARSKIVGNFSSPVSCLREKRRALEHLRRYAGIIITTFVSERNSKFTGFGQRGANLHNLCPVKGINENKKQLFPKAFSPINGGLEIVHLNIRSLKNRALLMELQQLTSERKSDIITISETWLNTTVTSSEIQIEGYKLHRLDRLHKGDDGVCACVRKDLKSSVLFEGALLYKLSELNFHQLWLSVQYKKLKSLVICVTYCPDGSPLSSFEEVLKPNYLKKLNLNTLNTLQYLKITNKS